MIINLKNKYHFTNDVLHFIESIVLPKLNISELNDDNIDDICEFACNIEIQYLNVKKLSLDEKQLYKIATKTVDQLSNYKD